MKIFKTSFVLIFSFFVFAAHSYGADVAKIGVVDFQRVLDSSTAGKSAKTEINKMGEEMKKDLQTKGSEIEELKNRLDKDAMVMSREKREEKDRNLRIKVNDFKSVQKRYRAQIQELEKKLVTKIQKDVVAIVTEIGKKDGYLLIVNKVGVLYSPGTIDITDKVIKIYNSKQQ